MAWHGLRVWLEKKHAPKAINSISKENSDIILMLTLVKGVFETFVTNDSPGRIIKQLVLEESPNYRVDPIFCSQ